MGRKVNNTGKAAMQEVLIQPFVRVHDVAGRMWAGFQAEKKVKLPIPPFTGLCYQDRMWPPDDIVFSEVRVAYDDDGKPYVCCAGMVDDHVIYATYKQVIEAYEEAGWTITDRYPYDAPVTWRITE
jgi:hypothetical protein